MSGQARRDTRGGPRSPGHLTEPRFVRWTLTAIALNYLTIADDTRRLIGDLNPLVMAFAIVNLVVSLALNPWRADRLPDRFPAIVQDTLLILLFGTVATLYKYAASTASFRSTRQKP